MDWIIDFSLTLGLETFTFIQAGVSYMYFVYTCTCICTALGVLCCFALFVCLTLLASFFLPSRLSFKNMYIHTVDYAV